MFLRPITSVCIWDIALINLKPYFVFMELIELMSTVTLVLFYVYWKLFNDIFLIQDGRRGQFGVILGGGKMEILNPFHPNTAPIIVNISRLLVKLIELLITITLISFLCNLKHFEAFYGHLCSNFEVKS